MTPIQQQDLGQKKAPLRLPNSLPADATLAFEVAEQSDWSQEERAPFGNPYIRLNVTFGGYRAFACWEKTPAGKGHELFNAYLEVASFDGFNPRERRDSPLFCITFEELITLLSTPHILETTFEDWCQPQRCELPGRE